MHEKYIVSQASQAEVAHTTSATEGLPAAVASHAQAPLQLQPPQFNQGLRTGAGKGGAGGTRKCASCDKHLGRGP